jgi:hypothetical protein
MPSQPTAVEGGMVEKAHHPQAVQETEIQRTVIPDQPRQKKKKKKILRLHLNGKKLGMVVCRSHPRYSRKLEMGGSQLGQKVRQYLQSVQAKKGW